VADDSATFLIAAVGARNHGATVFDSLSELSAVFFSLE
jgi:hypothetical protein